MFMFFLYLLTMMPSSINTSNPYKQNQSVPICSEEPSLPHLIDRVADIAATNREAGLILSGSLATTLILWVLADSATKLIKAWRT
jgi:hypothetical protein